MAYRDYHEVTVLVIDNESAVLLTIQTMLEYSGFRALIAHSGVQLQEVLKKASSEEPHVVILDIAFNDPSPVETAALIRRHNPGAVFLIASCDGSLPSPEVIEAIGPAGYLKKPYSDEELAAKIHSLFEKA